MNTRLLLIIGFLSLLSHAMADGAGGIVNKTGKTYSICIGIDNYKTFPLPNCKKDAIALHQLLKAKAPGDSNRHYLLLDEYATKDSILGLIRRISSDAKRQDRFVFFFAGLTYNHGSRSENSETHFCPAKSIDDVPAKYLMGDSVIDRAVLSRLISMKLLQEYVQLLPCREQMFIAEAASTENLNAEFASALMQGSPDMASLHDVNRVIVAPKKLGIELRDGGMLALAIQKMDTSKYNIYDLFNPEKANGTAQAILSQCEGDYATVFFEKDFIKLYQQINRNNPVMRSRNMKLNLPQPDKESLEKKKKYALIIGTDHYKGRGWDPLNNPIRDATEIATILKEMYGYEVTLLTDPTAENIYAHLLDQYSKQSPDDDFIIYIAGHGDYDKYILDDGFLVCTDSRSVEDDPMRNTYISHSKLKRILNRMPARQVLVLLDVCHAGTFDESVLGGVTRENTSNQALLQRNVNQFVMEKGKYVTRKVLTSVGKQPAFDGLVGGHSPFATYLLKLLYAAGGEIGLITASDLFSSLQKAGLNEESDMRIHPHQAGFGNHEPEAEFILLPVKK
ncbi:MAG TPA: caspase family protein [Phnomibacter sp.]|nr:caspase family protein [Phnomibacter sp.]